MTACLYASPWIDPERPGLGCVPLVLADTLVTWKGMNTDYEIIPSKFNALDDGRLSRVTLTRKVHIIEQAAIAMAGEGPLINQAREDFRWNIDEWAKGGRPMRVFGDYLNQFGLNRIQAVGAYAFPDSNQTNTLIAFEPFHMPQFGMCGVVGSGHEDIRVALDRIDREMRRDENVINKIRQLGHAINGTRLANEILGIDKNAWGGYIEYACLRPDRVWQRGPRSLDLFYVAKQVDGRKYTLGMLPRWVAYDPEGVGRILSLTGKPGDPPSYAEFRLGGQPAGRSTLEYWQDWSPESFAITVILRNDDGSSKTATLPCRIQDSHRAKISIKGIRLEVRVEEEYVDHLAGLILPHWELDYVPLREVPHLAAGN